MFAGEGVDLVADALRERRKKFDGQLILYGRRQLHRHALHIVCNLRLVAEVDPQVQLRRREVDEVPKPFRARLAGQLRREEVQVRLGKRLALWRDVAVFGDVDLHRARKPRIEVDVRRLCRQRKAIHQVGLRKADERIRAAKESRVVLKHELRNLKLCRLCRELRLHVLVLHVECS